MKNIDNTKLNTSNITFSDFQIKETHKSLLESKKFKYDQIIDDLGINKYNTKAFIIISLLILADGGEMMVIALITSKLDSLWNLTTTQKGIIGSSIFIGFFLGSFLSGKLSDTKGRKPAFIIGSIIVTIFAFLSSFSQNYQTLIILRALCGFGIGISIPAIFALTTEITPENYRSLVINWSWVFFPVGEILTVGFTYFLIDLENGWRYILVFATLPCAIVLILSFSIIESPKFLLISKKEKQGFEILRSILKENDLRNNYTITSSDEQTIMNEIFSSENSKASPVFSVLIAPEYKYLSILIWTSLFMVSLIYYGVLYILPQSLKLIENISNINKSDVTEDFYGELILSAIAELPSYIIAGYLANMIYLGRIKSTALGFLISVFSCLMAFVFPLYLGFWAGLIKFGMAMPFNILLLYTCEAFPTKIRGIAVGTANCFTRLGGIVTPLLSQLLFDFYYQLPYLVYLLASVAGLVCTFLLPFETLNRKIS